MKTPTYQNELLVENGSSPYPHYTQQAFDFRSSSDAVGLRALAIKVWRHKVIFLCVVATCVTAAVVQLGYQTPVYRATTSLEIRSPNTNLLNLADINPAASSVIDDTYVQTQLEVLRSKVLGSKVASRLDLQKRLELKSHEQAVAKAIDSLSIQVSRGTRLVKLSYDSTDPTLAADIVNALADEYIKDGIQLRWDGTQHVGHWLAKHVADLKQKMEQSENELHSYARTSGLMFVSEKDNVAEQQLRHLEEEFSKARADAIAKRARAEQIAASPAEMLSEISDSHSVRQLQAELVKQRQQRAELQSLLTPTHYKVKRVDAQITELESSLAQEKAGILSRVGTDYEGAQRREAMLAAAYKKQAEDVADLAAKEIRYDTLKREAEGNRQLYHSLTQKLKEASVASAIQASHIRVLDPAEIPKYPYKPRRDLTVLAGVLAGALFGSVVVMAKDGARLRRFVKPGEAELHLRLPELGVILNRHSALGRGYADENSKRLFGRSRQPVAGATRRFESDPGNPHTIEVAALSERVSVFNECIRSTLASLLFGQSDPRVLVVTSPNPGEGKTTAVCNLGIALTRMNRRVLLVDADVGKPKLHTILHVPSEPGFRDLLQARELDHSVIKSSIHVTSVPGLSVLPVGGQPHGFVDVMFSSRMGDLLSCLRKSYDFVLIDTPPVLAIAEARIIGRLSDAVLLVIRAGRTDRESATAARERLVEDGTRIRGIIFNDWDPSRSTAYKALNKYYCSAGFTRD